MTQAPPTGSAAPATRSRPRRRVVAAAALAVAATALVAAAAALPPVLAVGTGFVAKQMCSEVFVGGRAVDAVVGDLRETPPQWLIRIVRVHVDRAAGTAQASVPGLATSLARHRAGRGCALVDAAAPPEDGTPPP